MAEAHLMALALLQSHTALMHVVTALLPYLKGARDSAEDTRHRVHILSCSDTPATAAR